jgi:hypothetical protein
MQDFLEESRHRWKYNIEMNLQEVGSAVWTALIWFRIETDDWLL